MTVKADHTRYDNSCRFHLTYRPIASPENLTHIRLAYNGEIGG